MIFSFIKGKGAIQTYLTLCEKLTVPCLNHELTATNCIFWKSEFNVTNPTKGRLLPDLLNQEITIETKVKQLKGSQKATQHSVISQWRLSVWKGLQSHFKGFESQ